MTAKDIKILGITVTYNNEAIVPYVMPYYERMGIDKLIVYDNGSTDKTVELLSAYPFVEIRSYETPYYSEEKVLDIKSNAWKEYSNDYNWCISTYFDEVFYSKDDFRSVLYEKMCEGKTYFLKTGLNLVSREFPPVNNGKLAHENVGKGAIWASDDGVLGIYGNKVQLFNMKAVFVDYPEYGCHNCRLNGDAASFEDDIAFFHLKFLDFSYLLNQSAKYNERMNPDEGITCYDYFKNNLEKVYQQLENRSISVDSYMNLKMKDLNPPQVLFLVKESNIDNQIGVIDQLKAASSMTKWAQFGILFYGTDTKGDYSKTQRYGFDSHVFVRLNMGVDDPHEAARGYNYFFGQNLIVKNPWVCECPGCFFVSTVLQKVESVLSIANSEEKNSCECGLFFERFNSYIITDKKATTLGCYMIVKNEEKTIKNCLDSIAPLCDEIAVVDTGSSDKTIEIASQYPNVKTYHFNWVDDFSAARNFAMSKLDTEYTFATDADEEFTPELKDTIRDLKLKGFLDVDCLDINLLNYNGTDDLKYYLGGRQIVKSYPTNVWRYRVHEKLYCKEDKQLTVLRERGLILHKHRNKAVSTSNYNKYTEFYFDELNSGRFSNTENSAHFFYYMFLTMKDFDYMTAIKYIPYIFDPKRISRPEEELRAHLWRDNFIDVEVFIVSEAINADNDPIFIADILHGLTKTESKYLATKYLYDNDPKKISLSDYLNLAVTSYNCGLMEDFGKISQYTVDIYGNTGAQQHNAAFYNTYIKPTMENKTLVVDCREGHAHLASIIFYFSKMFNTISILCDPDELLTLSSKYSFDPIKTLGTISDESQLTSDCYLISANYLVTPQLAVKEFENIMYDKPTMFIKHC